MPRLKALVIAEMCNPEWQSVPLVGWHHANALRQYVDIHIVTRSVNRPALLRAGLVEGKDFTALDFEKLEQRILGIASKLRGGETKGWTILQAFSVPLYYYFEHLLWKLFRKRLQNGEFDVVHRLTPLSPIQPSLLAAKCRRVGVPFVAGPLNGGLRFPPAFRGMMGAEKEWLWKVRGLHKLLPGYHSLRRNAAALVVGSRSCAADMPEHYHRKCVYVPENGIDPQRFAAPANKTPGKPLRAVFIGRLTPYKGADMVLEALQKPLSEGKIILDVFGVGPMDGDLRQQVIAGNMGNSVTFHGNVSQQQLAEYLAQADILPSPSVREFGGGVVLEAMASGVVVLAADYGGPGEHIAGGAGIALPVSSRAALVDALRTEVERILQNPAHLASLRQNALQRIAAHYTWDAKARQTLEIYRWVLRERANKPDWGMPFDGSESHAV